MERYGRREESKLYVCMYQFVHIQKTGFLDASRLLSYLKSYLGVMQYYSPNRVSVKRCGKNAIVTFIILLFFFLLFLLLSLHTTQRERNYEPTERDFY